jgi:hypothetical protein
VSSLKTRQHILAENMSITRERVEKIRAFSERSRRIEKHYDEIPLSPDAIQSYNRKLDEAIRGLQGHVKRQEDVLQKVREAVLSFHAEIITT